MHNVTDTFSRDDSATLGVAESGQTWEQVPDIDPTLGYGVWGVVSNEAAITTNGATAADFAAAGISMDSIDRTLTATVGIPSASTVVALILTGVVAPSIAGTLVTVTRPASLLDPLTVAVVEGTLAGGLVVRQTAQTDAPYDELTITASLIDGEINVTATGGVTLGPLGTTTEGGGYVGFGTLGDTFSTGITVDDFAATALEVELEGEGPCQPWTTVADVQSCDGCATLSDAVVAQAIAVASQVLYNMSKRRYPGICSDVVRPCGPACGCVADRCSCPGLSQVTLGGLPIVAVSEVLVDGVALASSAYRVDNQRTLVRLDGDVWPCCQDMSEPTTEVDTWQVTYTYGRPVPTAAQLAAKLYACEIAKLCAGGECRLPARVQSISRQGVTAGFVDLGELAALGGIGIPYVDQWLESLDKGKQGRGIVMASPDVRPRVRRTGT